MSYLNKQNLLEYAFVNFDAVQKPIRGVVLYCHGYGEGLIHTTSPRPGVDLGNEGVLYIWPYYSPVAWCSDATVAFIDEVLDAVWEIMDLPEDCPFVIIGNSMGGLTSMIYPLYGKRKPLAVGCNCPVCDLASVFEVSVDFRRSIYGAYVGSGRPFEEELDRHNPILQVDKMPDVPYMIVSGTQDGLITEEAHIAPLQQAMRQAGKRATFLRVSGLGHCNLESFEDAYQTYTHFILKSLGLQA